MTENGDTTQNLFLQQLSQADANPVEIESQRFDTYSTHVPDVNLRTEPDVPARLLRPRYRHLLTSLIGRAESIIAIRRRIKEEEAEEDLLSEDLKVFAANRVDFRGFEFANEGAVVSVFPVYKFDPDRLQQSIGDENFKRVTDEDTLHLHVNLDGHPEAGKILEEAFRHSVRTTLRLKNDGEVNARLRVERSTTVRRDALRRLLKETGLRLLSKTVGKPDWRITVRDVHTPHA